MNTNTIITSLRKITSQGLLKFISLAIVLSQIIYEDNLTNEINRKIEYLDQLNSDIINLELKKDALLDRKVILVEQEDCSVDQGTNEAYHAKKIVVLKEIIEDLEATNDAYRADVISLHEKLQTKTDSMIEETSKYAKYIQHIEDSNKAYKEKIQSLERDIEHQKKTLEQINVAYDGYVDTASSSRAMLIKKIELLEHDLGHCNVEWGGCQQLNRQHEELDLKRLQKIADEMNKFELCSYTAKNVKQQLKYAKQLISMYENKSLWDRVFNHNK